ncbi:hypothetical protein PC119_g22359 [Phytophthora cactorum]|uniref:Uncharacterized protein n=2 Tax=Phytophthora cactorum TaxID=29920 RepID=A0A8T0Y853_9STRA|nr:hypothetical protein PC113_g20585 [Phytophthora cactorum]KAG2975886.1 hypothetical protein PC119_g22359 [Phytophthora cactorum]
MGLAAISVVILCASDPVEIHSNLLVLSFKGLAKLAIKLMPIVVWPQARAPNTRAGRLELALLECSLQSGVRIPLASCMHVRSQGGPMNLPVLLLPLFMWYKWVNFVLLPVISVYNCIHVKAAYTRIKQRQLRLRRSRPLGTNAALFLLFGITW